MSDRNAVISTIKAALKLRSGKVWSVTGGNGTSWGFLSISAPPARCTWHHRLKVGATNDYPESWEGYDSIKGNGDMTPTERAELSRLLGLDRPVHQQGLKICSQDWQNYIDRAEGRKPTRPDYEYPD